MRCRWIRADRRPENGKMRTFTLRNRPLKGFRETTIRLIHRDRARDQGVEADTGMTVGMTGTDFGRAGFPGGADRSFYFVCAKSMKTRGPRGVASA